jgi:hypothetical protein
MLGRYDILIKTPTLPTRDFPCIYSALLEHTTGARYVFQTSFQLDVHVIFDPHIPISPAFARQLFTAQRQKSKAVCNYKFMNQLGWNEIDKSLSNK